MSHNELFVVIIAAVILFGGKKMPEALRSWFRILRDLRRHYNLFKRQLELDLETLEHMEKQQKDSKQTRPENVDPDTVENTDPYREGKSDNPEPIPGKTDNSPS